MKSGAVLTERQQKWFATVEANFEKATGRPVAVWVDILKGCPETRPKALVEVAGRTLIDRVLDRLVEAGVHKAVVNVHHFADQMEAHLAGRTDLEIVIADERAALLDSGGGIRNILPFFGTEPFFSLNADTVWTDGPRLNQILWILLVLVTMLGMGELGTACARARCGPLPPRPPEAQARGQPGAV